MYSLCVLGTLLTICAHVHSTHTVHVCDTHTHTTDALANPAVVSTQLHPQFPFPGAVGLAPSPPEPSPQLPSEDTPLIMSSISDKPQGTVECMVQECPQFLHKGLMELFPGVKLKSQKLSVITLSEKTVHDMTGWSSNVEEEREQLLEHVSDTCTYTCMYLCDKLS